MDYTLNNWAALSVYPDDGWLDIDNNEGENAVRGIALGRKNWLFCGSDRGGRAAAIHFSLLASCSATAMIPGSICAMCSPVCLRCSPPQRRRPPVAAAPPLETGIIVVCTANSLVRPPISFYVFCETLTSIPRLLTCVDRPVPTSRLP